VDRVGGLRQAAEIALQLCFSVEVSRIFRRSCGGVVLALRVGDMGVLK